MNTTDKIINNEDAKIDSSETGAKEDIASTFGEIKDDLTGELAEIGSELKEEFAGMLDEFNEEKEEMFLELEAEQQEAQESLEVGSVQHQRDDLITNVSSISMGLIMAVIGTVLLVKTREVVGPCKKKVAGWILAVLGVGTVCLFLVQMLL